MTKFPDKIMAVSRAVEPFIFKVGLKNCLKNIVNYKSEREVDTVSKYIVPEQSGYES
jgi:hypothetical protein